MRVHGPAARRTARSSVRSALAFGVLAAAAVLMTPEDAAAQYRSYTFGFEAGYLHLTEDMKLKPHNVMVGMFGGYKGSDQWWYYSRAAVSFPGELDGDPHTVVLLHAVPISARYYFQTDAFRPYVGVTNSFQYLFNTNEEAAAFWGPGVVAGVEVKLRRDMFLGIELDAFYMFNFSGPDAQVLSASGQLIFFL